MSPLNSQRALIPYLRQSRKKEVTISIEEQRREITRWAEANGVKLLEEVIEQGVSGSKPWQERELGQVIADCGGRVSYEKDGEIVTLTGRQNAGGVIVAFQDRLTRESGLGTSEVWAALDSAQARLVCAAEGLDTATGDHEMLFQIKAAIAREQWKRHRKNWASATSNAVERGVCVSRTPAGYTKGGDGRLIPNGNADKIRAAFEARAKGATLLDVVRILDGVETSQGNTHWSRTNAARVLENDVYLGVIRCGDKINDNGVGRGALEGVTCQPTHEPLIGHAVFARVQAVNGQNGQNGRREPTRHAKHPLTGLLVCENCGRPLSPDHRVRDGNRWAFHRCVNDHCPGRATVGQDAVQGYLDGFVLEAALGAPDAVVKLDLPKPVDTQAEESELLEAQEGVKLYAATADIAVIGAEAFAAGLKARQERVEKAQEALAQAIPTGGDLPVELVAALDALPHEFREVDGKLEIRGEALGELLTQHLPLETRREFYARIFEKVVVKRGRKPIHEKVDVYVDGKLVPPRRVTT